MILEDLKKILKEKRNHLLLLPGVLRKLRMKIMLKREPYIDAVIGPQSYHKYA